jgi:cysteine synthase
MNRHYFDGWEKARLPVVPVYDKRVNMFADCGVEMAFVAGNSLPLGSFKFLAAKSLLDFALDSGVFQKGDVPVEATSGRTGNAITALAFGEPYCASGVLLVMKTDVPVSKRAGPAVWGAQIIGPDYELTPIQTARKIGGGGWTGSRLEKNGKLINLDQYANLHVADLYRDWAAPKIIDDFGEFDVSVIPGGTGGTLIGLNEGFQNRFDHKITRVVALCAPKQEIPGMRDELIGMSEVAQPWQKARDYTIEVQRRAAFLCAPWITRVTQIPAGPSGGATYVAGCMFLQQLIDKGKLDSIRNQKTGLIKMLMVIHDDIGPYLADRFLSEFSLEEFRPATASLPQKIIFG